MKLRKTHEFARLVPLTLALGATGLLCLLLTAAPKAPPAWKPVADWLKLPPGMSQMGNAHGDVAVSSKGEVFVSLLGGLRAGVQVYSADGKYLRNLPDAPKDLHGFVIHRGADGEFIYGPLLGGQKIVKMTLAGKVVTTIPAEAIPINFWRLNAKANKRQIRLTACDVAPNGDSPPSRNCAANSRFSSLSRSRSFNSRRWLAWRLSHWWPSSSKSAIRF